MLFFQFTTCPEVHCLAIRLSLENLRREVAWGPGKPIPPYVCLLVDLYGQTKVCQLHQRLTRLVRQEKVLRLRGVQGREKGREGGRKGGRERKGGRREGVKEGGRRKGRERGRKGGERTRKKVNGL